MYVPSYDFDLFDLPQFSPLQAQEFGAETSFRANTPLSFVDWSLNQFAGLMNPRASYPYVQSQFPSGIDTNFGEPFFQGAEDVRERLRRVRDEANRALGEAGAAGTKSSGECTEGRNIFGGCGPILGSKTIKSDDSSVGTNTPTGQRIGDATKESLKSIFENLPAGAGVFLIAVVVIILLFLFVKK